MENLRTLFNPQASAQVGRKMFSPDLSRVVGGTSGGTSGGATPLSSISRLDESGVRRVAPAPSDAMQGPGIGETGHEGQAIGKGTTDAGLANSIIGSAVATGLTGSILGMANMASLAISGKGIASHAVDLAGWVASSLFGLSSGENEGKGDASFGLSGFFGGDDGEGGDSGVGGAAGGTAGDGGGFGYGVGGGGTW
jgi:hypothetical protein